MIQTQQAPTFPGFPPSLPGINQQPVLLRAVCSPATPANCIHLSLPTLQSVTGLLWHMSRGEMELEADTERARMVWNSSCCGFVTKAGNVTGEVQMDSRGLTSPPHTACSSGSTSGLELFGNHFTSFKSYTRWRSLQKFTNNTLEKVNFHRASHLQGGTAAPRESFLQTIIQLELVPDLIKNLCIDIWGTISQWPKQNSFLGLFLASTRQCLVVASSYPLKCRL